MAMWRLTWIGNARRTALGRSEQGRELPIEGLEDRRNVGLSWIHDRCGCLVLGVGSLRFHAVLQVRCGRVPPPSQSHQYTMTKLPSIEPTAMSTNPSPLKSPKGAIIVPVHES